MEGYFERFGGVRDYLKRGRGRGPADRLHRDDPRPPALPARPDLRQPPAARDGRADGSQRPIQGSAADIIKVAMLNVDRALAARGRAPGAAPGARRARPRGRPGGARRRRDPRARRDGAARRRWTCPSTSTSEWAAPGTTRPTDRTPVGGALDALDALDALGVLDGRPAGAASGRGHVEQRTPFDDETDDDEGAATASMMSTTASTSAWCHEVRATATPPATHIATPMRCSRPRHRHTR